MNLKLFTHAHRYVSSSWQVLLVEVVVSPRGLHGRWCWWLAASTGNLSEYKCDDKCPQYKSLKICSHTVAAAGSNGDIDQFMSVYWKRYSSGQPNLSELAIHDVPAGAGQKGGKTFFLKKKTLFSSIINKWKPHPLTGKSNGWNDKSNYLQVLMMSQYQKVDDSVRKNSTCWQPQASYIFHMLLALHSHIFLDPHSPTLQDLHSDRIQ